jgi:hypothetical protein
VAGRWALVGGGGELLLEQTFQVVTGTLTTGNVAAPLVDAKLDGERLTFTAGGKPYTGQVKGDTIEGAGPEGHWQATRK